MTDDQRDATRVLVPAGALPAETVDGWAGLGAAPIVNVHVIYDRKVMDVPFAAAVDSPVQWVFDRTRISGMHEGGMAGQYLAISLSAADEYAGKPVAELREQFVPALAELFPAAKAATVTKFFVTREKRATFRQVPGTAKLRPQAATDLPGLVLAGAWTDTGWPDTMEGAVRSGYLAGQKPEAGGGHAVTLVGYKCSTGRIEDAVFTFKNSWGPQWGQGGYGMVTYGYLSHYLDEAILLEVQSG